MHPGTIDTDMGDQVLVKVLAIEGNKIRLSRKALIKEAREKQGLGKKEVAPAAPAGETAPVSSTDESN